MAVKDIVVHVDASPSADLRLDLAIKIAEQHHAHLIGVHARPFMHILATPDVVMPPSYFVEQQRQIDANAHKAKIKFDAAIAKASASSEWRQSNGMPSDVIRRHARYADLVIVGQNNPDADDQAGDLPDGILLDTGRPVLIVPNGQPKRTFARCVLIAWDAGAPAARALNDALALIEKNTRVIVMAVDPRDTGDHGAIPCADICLHLARHGLRAEAYSITSPETDAPGAILGKIFGEGCDLLVMGAYGHSRMREFVFGGMTAEMLKRMTVPVLMSH